MNNIILSYPMWSYIPLSYFILLFFMSYFILCYIEPQWRNGCTMLIPPWHDDGTMVSCNLELLNIFNINIAIDAGQCWCIKVMILRDDAPRSSMTSLMLLLLYYALLTLLHADGWWPPLVLGIIVLSADHDYWSISR